MDGKKNSHLLKNVSRVNNIKISIFFSFSIIEKIIAYRRRIALLIRHEQDNNNCVTALHLVRRLT